MVRHKEFGVFNGLVLCSSRLEQLVKYCRCEKRISLIMPDLLYNLEYKES